MIYDVARVRRLSTIFQVDTCKTKKERIAVACAVEIQAMIYNAARVRRFPTNCKSIHAKVKKIDLCMRSCSPCS